MSEVPNHIFSQIKALLVFMLLLFFSITNSTYVLAGVEPSAKDTLQNNATDTIMPTEELYRRWDNPEFDIRFERGTLQPWHDIRSIYLRRTIPLNHLALLRREEQSEA